MGVKSTITLTREEALRRMTDIATARLRGRLGEGYAALTNTELENLLEQMNDQENGGEGFENYTITNEG